MAAILVSALALGSAAHSTASAAPASGGWPALRAVPGMAGRVSPADVPDRTSSGAACRNLYFPVTLGGNDSHVYREYGQLCTDSPATLGSQPIQILLPGGTVSHKYFDWPYQPNRYNYVKYMTQRGYTTLSVDRLGYGNSDHPSAEALNFDVAGWNTHQLVQSLRGGALGVTFRKIVLNGYSMGGLTAQIEAENWRDVDAVAIHAVGHQLLTASSTFHLAQLAWPAALDPKFAGQPWTSDPGYLTTIPGQRAQAFYGPPTSYDPAQIPIEEDSKVSMTATELVDITAKSYSDATRNIAVPVLWSPGQYDRLWCGTTDDCFTDPESAREASNYRPGLFTQYIVPNTGHAALLGYGGGAYMNHVAQWLDRIGIPG